MFYFQTMRVKTGNERRELTIYAQYRRAVIGTKQTIYYNYKPINRSTTKPHYSFIHSYIGGGMWGE